MLCGLCFDDFHGPRGRTNRLLPESKTGCWGWVGEVAFPGHPVETYLSHLLFQLALLWLGTNVHYPGGSGTLSRRWPEYVHFRGSPRTFLLFPSSQTRSRGHLRPFPVLFSDQSITRMLWHLFSISYTLQMRTEG